MTRLQRVLLVTIASAASGLGVSCEMATLIPQPGGADSGEISTDGRLSPLGVQALAMKMADEWVSTLSEALRPIIIDPREAESARQLVQRFQRNGTASAIDIAVESNPDVGVLDMLVLASLQTWAFTSNLAGMGVTTEAAQQAAARLARGEADLWSSAQAVLSEAQQQTLRGLIGDWISQNPDRTYVSFVRFDQFLAMRRENTTGSREAASGLLREVSQAGRSVDNARLLGERALWYAARYPIVLGLQAETSAYNIAQQPGFSAVIAAIDAIGKASGTLSQRLDALAEDLKAQQQVMFDRVSRERTAAIEQARDALVDVVKQADHDLEARLQRTGDRVVAASFDRLAQERKALLDDLESRQGAMRTVLTEFNTTMTTSTALARELSATLQVLDRIVSRFDRPAGAGHEPLDMKDVRDAAAEATRAAEKLTVLLERTNALADSDVWDRRMAQLNGVGAGVIDRAFWRLLVIVAAVMAGLALLRLLPRRGHATPPRAPA